MSLRYGVALSEREREVLDAVCREGLTNAGAAVKLGLSAKTIDSHLAHARVKLGVVDARQLGYRFALLEVRDRAKPDVGGYCPVCQRGR